MLAAMFTRKTFLFACAFFCWLGLKAEPLNVLVGELTFTRPEEWAWESPNKSNILTRFIIPTESAKAVTTDVRFYLTQMDSRAAATLWRSHFPQAKDGKDIWEETKKIGRHNLTYVSLTGTQIYPGSKPKPNCTFFGAIIPSGNDFVHVRMFGPTPDVEKARDQFKKMVENALSEKEGE